jgi:hypothetical protein
MKAYEFPAQLIPEGKLEVDKGLLPSLPVKQMVKIILLIDEPDDAAAEKSAWAQLTAEQFVSGYSEADAIYDNI